MRNRGASRGAVTVHPVKRLRWQRQFGKRDGIDKAVLRRADARDRFRAQQIMPQELQPVVRLERFPHAVGKYVQEPIARQRLGRIQHPAQAQQFGAVRIVSRDQIERMKRNVQPRLRLGQQQARSPARPGIPRLRCRSSTRCDDRRRPRAAPSAASRRRDRRGGTPLDNRPALDRSMQRGAGVREAPWRTAPPPRRAVRCRGGTNACAAPASGWRRRCAPTDRARRDWVRTRNTCTPRRGSVQRGKADIGAEIDHPIATRQHADRRSGSCPPRTRW